MKLFKKRDKKQNKQIETPAEKPSIIFLKTSNTPDNSHDYEYDEEKAKKSTKELMEWIAGKDVEAGFDAAYVTNKKNFKSAEIEPKEINNDIFNSQS